MASINIIEIPASSLSVASMRAAISAAAGTTLPDLVVARTTASQHTVTYSNSLDGLAISGASTQGALSIVGFGETSLTIDAAQKNRVVSVGGSDTATTVVNMGNLLLRNGLIGGNDGGGIYQRGGTLTLQHVTVTGNRTSTKGGGIYQSKGTLTAVDVTISENTAGGSGGGMCLYDATSALTDAVITGNVSSSGGGVYLGWGESSLSNVVIAANRANGDGGGIWLAWNSGAMTNITVAGNTATSKGGGIYHLQGSATWLYNSVVAKNTGWIGYDIYVDSASYPLYGANNFVGIGEGQASLIHGVDGNLVGTTASPADPFFVDTSGPDARTWDLRLQAGSYAINAGDNAKVPVGVTTDLDGDPRITDGIVDMGAYEYSLDNSAPNDIALSSSSIVENQPSGTVVGTLSTSDPDVGNTFTYLLVSGIGSTDNASFTISGNQLLTGASFSYEAKSSYSIRVRTTDQGGLSYEKQLAIGVTDVNEAPTDLTLARRTTVFSDSFTGGPLPGWTEFDGVFSGTGGVYSVGSTGFANDARTVHHVADTTWGDYTLDVDFNLANTGTAGWPAAVMFRVQEVQAGIDAGRYYQIDLGPSLLKFSKINYTGGNAIILTQTDYSMSAGAWHHLTLQVTGSTVSAFIDGSPALTYSGITDFGYGGIGLKSINSATTLYDNVLVSLTQSASAPENQPSGMVVGTLSSIDPDAGNTFTYSLVSGTGSGDNASFAISGNQLLTAASFDYEAKSSYSIRVRTTDQSGLWLEKSFTINVTDVDEIAPTVTGVYVRGSSWDSGYLSFLAANLAGSSATYGYAVPVGTGAAQLQTLPWRNLDQISIAFSEDVSVAQAQFAIVGSVGSYSVSGFAYSSTDHVATWSLSAAIGPDKLYVALPGTGASPIVDLAGNVLDGEWSNPSSYSDASSSDSFPSGNGAAGGDFAFRFDVLPGDSSGGSLGKVNVADALQTKSRSGLPVTVSTYRSDFDGNNLVNVADVAYVKSKSSVYSLPVNPPVMPTFGPVFGAMASQVSLLQKDRAVMLW